MKVILAIDDSVYSQSVVESVIKRQWPIDTEFKVLTVLEPLCCNEFERNEWDEILPEVEKRQRKHAEQYVGVIKHKLESQFPRAKVHEEIRDGKAKSEILDAALEWSADKILLGAHSKGVCPHNLLGSVSSSVAAHAPCTIEIIRPKQPIKHKRQSVMAHEAASQ
jgi:nucleotide-binding universal stress UspA family protein